MKVIKIVADFNTKEVKIWRDKKLIINTIINGDNFVIQLEDEK